MTKRAFWLVLYGWAFLFHGLLWIHIRINGSKIELAIVTMAIGLLLIWGVFIAIIQTKVMKKYKPITVTTFKFILLMVLSMTTLALLAEVVSTTMTNTAYFWNLSPSDAFITASPNYIEVVTRHSVIVFIPQFIAIALLHYRYSFKPFEWFIIYGLIGYLNEWLAFGEAASWVSIPYWIIIYGWIVYLPAYLLLPNKTRLQTKAYHYVLAILLPILLSIPWAFLILRWFHS